MPVTELALLHTKNHQPLTPKSKSALVAGAAAQATFSSYPVRLYTQATNESYIYLVGGWESIAQHVHKWIPSSTNQDIMAELGEELDLVWMFHVDVEPYADDKKDSGSPLHANVLGIERWFVSEGKMGDFDKGFSKAREDVGRLSKWETRAGWRMDYHYGQREDGMSEFILLTGWETSADHDSSVETRQLGVAESLVQKTEVRYALPMRLE